MNENTDRLSDEAFAQQIIQAKRHIQTDATFAADLRQKLMLPTPQQKPEKSARPIIRLLGAAAAALMLASVSVLTIPPLRAIAQDIIDFVVPGLSDKAVVEMSLPTTPDLTVFTSVQEAESALSQDFAELMLVPTLKRGDQEAAAEIEEIVYDPDTTRLTVYYAPPGEEVNASGLVTARGSTSYWTWHLWFTQVPSAILEAHGSKEVGKSAQIETLTFTFKGKPVSAQFVRGGWTSGVDEEPDLEALEDGESVMVDATWINDERISLMWEAEGTAYSLNTVEEENFGLTRETLIQIAQSIE